MAAAGAACALLLAACSGETWPARIGELFGWTTPTPTATPRAGATPTADVRATLVAEDLATQIAYSTALATRGIADPFLPTDTPTPILLPTAVAPEPTPSPEAGQPESPLAPPTDTPVPAPPPPGDTPTPPVSELPTPVPVTVAADTPTATATAAVVAEAAPTSTPTPTITPTFLVQIPPPVGSVPTPTPPGALPSPTVQFPALQLAAQVGATPAELYFGPSSVFTRLVDGPPGSDITLFGRDGTGEWLFMCCPPNITDGSGAWVRSAAVRPVNNPTPPGMPTTVSPNDVGRLSALQPPAAITPLPTPQAIPPNDFPVFRRDRTLQGRVGQLPRLPLTLIWPPGGNPQTTNFTSGVVVFGDNVVAASSDNHIYSLYRDSGSQRWRFNVGETVTTEPAVEGGWLYFVTPSGRIFELDSEGNASSSPWPLGVGGQPYEGIVGWANRLFITANANGQDHLYMVDRIIERVAVDYAPASTSFPHAPAVGNQLVYVAGSAVLALDAFSNPAAQSTVGDAKLVWQKPADGGIPFTTAPVYSFPGVRALAELYVGDAQGRVWAFDANTGERLGVSPPNGQPATMLTVNSRMVYAAGGGALRAWPRDNVVQNPWWTQAFGGGTVNSLLADESFVMASAENGTVQVYDASLGTVAAGNVNTTNMAGPPAVSGGWLFVAGTNGTMFGLREGTP